MTQRFRDYLKLVEAERLAENASSGATSAASVATVAGGAGSTGAGAIGVGFDPNGHERSIYGKPKGKKGSGTVLRR